MATKKQPTPVFPSTIGASIDLLYTMREERLIAQRAVDEMEKKEGALRSHIMANFANADIDGAKGRVATASIQRSMQAEIIDFEEFVRWAVKKKAYSCLQKRVGITSVREYWDNGDKVPGLEPKEVVTLSLVKAGG